MNNVVALAETNATAKPRPTASLWQMFGAKLDELRFRLGAAACAHERRRTWEAVGADTMRDLGMAPETVTGLPSWEADLPFFMQSGFGRQ